MADDPAPVPTNLGTPSTPITTKAQWAPKEWLQVAQLVALVGLLYLVSTGKATVDQVDKYLPFLIGSGQVQLPANPAQPTTPVVNPVQPVQPTTNVVKPVSSDDLNKAIKDSQDTMLKAFEDMLDKKLKAFE